MDCPVCHWPADLKQQWETHGFACALFRCSSCECDVSVKTPVAKMKSWDSSSVEHKNDVLDDIQSLIEDARPSKLRDLIHDLLND